MNSTLCHTLKYIHSQRLVSIVVPEIDFITFCPQSIVAPDPTLH